jgi:2'-5' RNA ligase
VTEEGAGPAPEPALGAPATALIIEVPEAEPLVATWRATNDPAAAIGVPAHVTILFPFVDPGAVDDRLEEAVRALAADHPAFETSFSRVGGAEGVIWLVPEPDAPFRALTRDAWDRFPEHPPYGGQFDDVIPHLTIGQGEATAMASLRPEVERELDGHLPLAILVDALSLFVSAGGHWSRTARFPLADH